MVDLNHSLDCLKMNTALRQKLRLKLRDQQIQKSFRQTRHKFQLMEKQQIQQRNIKRQYSPYVSNNPFIRPQKLQNSKSPSPIRDRDQYLQQNYVPRVQNQSNYQQNNANFRFRDNNYLYGLIANNKNIANAVLNSYQQILNFNNFFQPFEKIEQNIVIKAPEKRNVNFQEEKKILKQKKKVDDGKKVLTRYQNYIVYHQQIGKGTYSKVYLGLNVLNNIKVAIKQIVQFQENQIKALMSVNSPYIIKLQKYWRDTETDKTYLVFQLCQRNLRQQLKKGISQQQKLKYIQHIVRGMDALFQKKIIHRDLKFQNILVTIDKKIKITDFGLAKLMGNYSIVQSIRCGTPYTMAPQIFFNDGYNKPFFSQKCDIWSIGIIMHEILYNKHPFNLKSQNLQKMQRIYINKKYGHLDKIIDKALRKQPQQRIDWAQFKKIYFQQHFPKKITSEQEILFKIENQRNKKEIIYKKEQIEQQQEKKIKKIKLTNDLRNQNREFRDMNRLIQQQKKQFLLPDFQGKYNQIQNIQNNLVNIDLLQPRKEVTSKQKIQKGVNLNNCHESGFARNIRRVMNAPKRDQKLSKAQDIYKKQTKNNNSLLYFQQQRGIQSLNQINQANNQKNKPQDSDFHFKSQPLLYLVFFVTLYFLLSFLFDMITA